MQRAQPAVQCWSRREQLEIKFREAEIKECMEAPWMRP